MARYINSRGAVAQEGIPYVSMYDPQYEQGLLQALAQRQARYDAGVQAMTEYKSQIAGATLNSADRPYVEKQLGKDVEELSSLVKNEYNGDYGAAINRLSDEITSRKNYYLPAVQRYQEQQKVDPVVRQLEAEDKLIWNGGTDPRQQSVYNEEGKFAGIPQYNFKARSDYDKEIANRFKAAGDKITEVVKRSKSMPGYFEAIKTKGLGALSPEDLNRIVSDNDVQNFIKETTYGIDPTLKGQDAKSYIIDKLNSIFTTQTDKQYIWDKLGEDMRAMQGSQQNQPLAIPWKSTNIVTDDGSIEKTRGDLNDLKEKLTIWNTGRSYKQSLPKGFEEIAKSAPGGTQSQQYQDLMLTYGKEGYVKNLPELENLKDKYKPLWERNKSVYEKDPLKFVNDVTPFVENDTKTEQGYFRHPDIEFQGLVVDGIGAEMRSRPGSKYEVLDENFKKDGSLNVDDIQSVEDVQINPYKGTVVARVKTESGDKHIKVNNTELSDITKKRLENTSILLKKFKSYDTESYEPTVLPEVVNIPGTVSRGFPMYYRDKNDDNIYVKYVDVNGEPYTMQGKEIIMPTDINTIIQENLTNLAVGYNPLNKKLR